MSGRARLPGGEPRKASQRNTPLRCRGAATCARTWKSGDVLRWKERAGTFHRDVGDGEHAEIALDERLYRVQLSELN